MLMLVCLVIVGIGLGTYIGWDLAAKEYTRFYEFEYIPEYCTCYIPSSLDSSFSIPILDDR